MLSHLTRKGIIAGILSERDIVNGLANAGQPILNMAATQFMTHDVIVSHPEDSMAKLMSIMSDKTHTTFTCY